MSAGGSAALAAALALACEGRDLDEAGAAAAIEAVMGGTATDAQVGALLGALHAKGETVEEVAGAARAMRARAEPVRCRRAPLVDTCGTGGDGGSTFSVSTAAALVAAGAGAAVAKHGNRAASGRFGGADVLEALGVAIDLPGEAVARCIDETGIGFLFARRLHPAMAHVAGPRREIGVRTIFNLLGPLTNPAGATRQVIGVSSPRALELVSGALLRLGCEHALVVHSRDGLDEIALTAPIDAVVVRSGEAKRRELSAADFGLAGVPRAALDAADLADAVGIVRAILAGEPGPRADVVAANAAAALHVVGIAATLPEGVERARASIASGAAKRALEALVAFTRAAAGTSGAVGGPSGRANV